MPQLTILSGPVITAGTFMSGVMDAGTDYIVGVVMPDLWTPAVVSVVVSPDGANFYDLHEISGAPVSFNVTPGAIVNINPNRMMLARYLQFRSGTKALPVVQPVTRNFRAISTMRLALMHATDDL